MEKVFIEKMREKLTEQHKVKIIKKSLKAANLETK